MLSQKPARRVPLGGDKAYDTGDFVEQLRGMKVTPHMAQNDTNRHSAIDGRTTRHKGYACQPAQAKACGGSVRLDETISTAAENALPRTGEDGLDVRLGGGSVHPREDAQSSGGYRIGTSASKGRKHPFGHKKAS
jgi:hypothetical protein